MSKNDRLIEIEIPREEVLGDLTEFIEEELKPPSRVKWIFIYFLIGLLGGVGLGAFIGWIR
jgi:hypothetical protein